MKVTKTGKSELRIKFLCNISATSPQKHKAGNKVAPDIFTEKGYKKAGKGKAKPLFCNYSATLERNYN